MNISTPIAVPGGVLAAESDGNHLPMHISTPIAVPGGVLAAESDGNHLPMNISTPIASNSIRGMVAQPMPTMPTQSRM